MLTLLVSAAVALLGHGFTQWARRLSEFSSTVDKRLDKMHNENKQHWEEASTRLRAQEKEFSRIHLCVERRLTKLETKTEE